jgi:DNA-binding transcriptional regulator YhcF (GntR family)
MPITVTIDHGAPTPPYEQLRMHVIDGVRSGRLPAGERMPTVRALASQLGLAVNTVAKAYRALEVDGVIETRGRAGTFVAATGDATRQQVQRAALDYARIVARLDLPDAEAIESVRLALAATRKS